VGNVPHPGASTGDPTGPAASELLAALFLAGHLAGVDLAGAGCSPSWTRPRPKLAYLICVHRRSALTA